MSCQEKSGFLFSHACAGQGAHRCALCQKGVCQKHSHMLNGQVACTSCAKKQKGIHKNQHQRQEDEYWTSSPFFYGYYHYDGYGYYRRGYWGSDYMNDDNDFSPSDGDNFGGGGSDFEHDMGGS